MHCPKCLSENEIIRKKRTKLQRLIPSAKLFKCKSCYCSFIWVTIVKSTIIINKGVSNRISQKTLDV